MAGAARAERGRQEGLRLFSLQNHAGALGRIGARPAGALDLYG